MLPIYQAILLFGKSIFGVFLEKNCFSLWPYQTNKQTTSAQPFSKWISQNLNIYELKLGSDMQQYNKLHLY